MEIKNYNVLYNFKKIHQIKIHRKKLIFHGNKNIKIKQKHLQNNR